MNTTRAVAQKLKQARQAAGLTQQEVADALGLARTSYTRIETGDNALSLEHLLKLSQVLRRPITDFLPIAVDETVMADRLLHEPGFGEWVQIWEEVGSFEQREALLHLVREIKQLILIPQPAEPRVINSKLAEMNQESVIKLDQLDQVAPEAGAVLNQAMQTLPPDQWRLLSYSAHLFWHILAQQLDSLTIARVNR